MLRRVTVIIIMLIMAFAMVACDTVDNNLSKSPEVKLSKLQTESIAELDEYPLGEEEYSAENWVLLSGLIAEAKASITTTEDTETITWDVMRVKAYVDWINAGKPVVEGLIGLGTVEGLSPERELAIIKKAWGEEFRGQESLDYDLIQGTSLTNIWKVLGTVSGYLAVQLEYSWLFGHVFAPFEINGVSFVGYYDFLLFYNEDNNVLSYQQCYEKDGYGQYMSDIGEKITCFHYDLLSTEDVEQVKEWHKLQHPDDYEDRIFEKKSYSVTVINSFLSPHYDIRIIASSKSELIFDSKGLYCFNDDPSAYADEDDYNKKYNNEGCKKIRSYNDDFFKDNALVLCGVNIYAKEEIPIILKSVRIYACRLYLNIDCPEYEEVSPKISKHQYMFVLEIPKDEIENCNSVWTTVRQNGTMEDYPPYDEVIDIDVNMGP